MRLIGWIGLALLIQFCTCNVGVTQSPEAAQDDPDSTTQERVYRGRVIDTDGNGIENATVLFNDYGKEISSETPASHITQSDGDGRFEIRVQAVNDPKPRFSSDYVWAYKEGYNLRCVCPRNRSLGELELVLSDSTVIPFQFTHPDGVPFEATDAAPYQFALPNGRYTADEDTGLSGPLPKTIRRLLSRPVASNGTVEISGVSTPLLERLEVSSPSLGKQLVHLEGRNRLVSCGSLSGKIECPPKEMPAQVKVFVTVRADRRPIAMYSATAIDGLFSFEKIPAGKADVQIQWPESSAVMPVPPRSVDIAPKNQSTLRVPVVPVVDLRGRVVLSDTGDPVTQGRLSIRSKRFAGVSRTVLTDEEGWYEAKMPSGETTIQLFVMQHSATHQYPHIPTIEIPDNVERFEVNVIKVDPKRVIDGFLIDERGKRVANRHVIVWTAQFGHLQGICKTDNDGRFQLKLNNWDADRVSEALQKKENGVSGVHQWELRVLPPDKIGKRSVLDDIASIKSYPSIKIRSFSPVVIQIINSSDLQVK